MIEKQTRELLTGNYGGNLQQCKGEDEEEEAVQPSRSAAERGVSSEDAKEEHQEAYHNNDGTGCVETCAERFDSLIGDIFTRI